MNEHAIRGQSHLDLNALNLPESGFRPSLELRLGVCAMYALERLPVRPLMSKFLSAFELAATTSVNT